MKIMIGLLGKPKESKNMGGGGLLEPEMEVPAALVDEKVNIQNKANAVMKANYGKSEDKMRYCGNCEYFDTEYQQLAKGEGLCEIWEFKCSDKNLCAAYEFDNPEENDQEESDSEMESD